MFVNIFNESLKDEKKILYLSFPFASGRFTVRGNSLSFKLLGSELTKRKVKNKIMKDFIFSLFSSSMYLEK
jgi:hypothetical protein